MSSHYTLSDRDEPALSGLERDLYDAVSADEPWALVERFADLERVSGTEDERAAAAYVADRLDALGVPYDRYDPELYLSRPQDASVDVAGTGERFESAKTVAFSNSGSVRGEAVFLGSEENESDHELAGAFDVGTSIADAEVDLDGKVVIAESILPIKAIGEAAERGAAAFVGIHPHEREAHEGIATPVWGGVPDPEEPDAIPDLAVANVSRTDGDRLLERVADGPVELSVSADVTTGWYACPVIVARIPGGAAPDEDDFVLVHGHYDSWYVGITDNATGDGAILELARVFADHRERLSRDLWVAWWPGHSTGRYAGSTWFLDENALAFADRCVATLNVDSPGVKDATEMDLRVKWMSEAHDLCATAIADVTGKETVERRPSRAGDRSFYNLGISGVGLYSGIPDAVREERGYHPVGGSGGHAEAWHLSTDTIDKADPDVLVRDVRLYATVIARLANREPLPLDFRRTLARHREIVREYDAAAGEHFDLSPVLGALESLADAVDDLYAAVDDGHIDAATATGAIKDLSRTLVPLEFAERGRFEQDPALARPPYPRLAPVATLPDRSGDDYRFAKVHLKRQRNHVEHALRAVRRALPE